MAIYRLETRIIGRRAKDKAGKIVPNQEVSIVAKAAYRAGEKLKDQRTDKTYNYRSRSQEVVHSEIMAPATAPEWLRREEGQEGAKKVRDQRERLWNAVEKVERRCDSQLAREFILSLPKELDKAQRIELVQGWCKTEFVDKGFVVDFALHKSKRGTNPHAHVLCVLRPVAGDGFGKKPSTAGKFNGRGATGLGAKDELGDWRKSWCDHENAALEKAGRPERVTHLSLVARGVDKIPQPKIGPDAAAMQRDGKIADPEAMKRLREVKATNELLPILRSFQRGERVPRFGPQAEWWQRARSQLREIASRVSDAFRSVARWGERVREPAPAAQPAKKGLDR